MKLPQTFPLTLLTPVFPFSLSGPRTLYVNGPFNQWALLHCTSPKTHTCRHRSLTCVSNGWACRYWSAAWFSLGISQCLRLESGELKLKKTGSCSPKSILCSVLSKQEIRFPQLIVDWHWLQESHQASGIWHYATKSQNLMTETLPGCISTPGKTTRGMSVMWVRSVRVIWSPLRVILVGFFRATFIKVLQRNAKVLGVNVKVSQKKTHRHDPYREP